MYDMPEEIDVQADGALRIITLNRPDALNAVNDALHVGLAKIWDALNEDAGARAAVITGAGRAFSAGGDFNYLDELRGNEALRQKTIKHGRDIVIGMVRCRIPVIAAVNGPAVGLGCSLAAAQPHGRTVDCGDHRNAASHHTDDDVTAVLDRLLPQRFIATKLVEVVA